MAENKNVGRRGGLVMVLKIPAFAVYKWCAGDHVGQTSNKEPRKLELHMQLIWPPYAWTSTVKNSMPNLTATVSEEPIGSKVLPWWAL